MANIQKNTDCSLLDMHSYSKKAFFYLLDRLQDKKFNKEYIDKENPIASITGFLWDITQRDEEVINIVKGMDKTDQIKAESSVTKLEKITETWIKKAYRAHFSQGFKISCNSYLHFIINIMQPNNEEHATKLRFSSKNLFDKIYTAYRARQHSIGNSSKFIGLVKRYPRLNVDKAYRYAIISGKFNLNADDIEEFEYILKFALSKKEDIK